MSTTSQSSAAKKQKSEKAEEVHWPMFRWRGVNPAPVIGVDEVGRGCLAGDVYAAAVILPIEFKVRGITDSKLLSEKERDKLEKKILANARVSIGIASVEEIDSINILQASFLAMRRAIAGLGVERGHVLVDGHMRIPALADSFQQTPLIKGDLRATPIGAASIIAKVARDRKMQELAKVFPGYGFESHKGYASPEHREAIRRLGPCVHHRSTFSGVKEFLVSIDEVALDESAFEVASDPSVTAAIDSLRDPGTLL